MELGWALPLLLLFASLVILMAGGLPVAIAFLVINILGAIFLWGGEAGLKQLLFSMSGSVSQFSFVAVPLFVLMGEVMFRAEIAPNMLDALDKWLGRLPGRLSLLAVGGGTLFATLTGASMASVAMLGSALTPEMEKRGYKKSMSLGPILGSSGLAIMIPPSSLAVLLGAIGEISVGRILIAIIIPGLIMASLYAVYIIVRCLLQPSIAPAYHVSSISWPDKVVSTAKYILPTGFIIFLVIGVMLLGIATPSEAAATGAAGMFILAAAYQRLKWDVVKKSIAGTVEITVMLFIIITGADAFSQILAFTGATRGMARFALSLAVEPIFIVLIMQVVLIFMGMFLEVASIMLITLPLFVPIILALGFDPVWFAAMYLLNMEMSVTSPPFGLNLFVMKGVAPPGTTMGDIYRAALPFLICDFVALVLIMAFPSLALWLPGLMRRA